MNKTVKYILISLAVFFGVMFLTMLFMRPAVSMQIQTQTESAQSQVLSIAQTAEVRTVYQDISTKDLASMLENKDFTLVNVHVPYIGDIEGTDVFIPFNEIADSLDKLPEDKTSKIVLYCQSGGMSAVAADSLSQLGYSNVYDVKGGMIQWQKDGNTLLKNN